MTAYSFHVDHEYWGDRLEVPIELVMKQHAQEDHMRGWVASLSPRCRVVLAEHLGIDLEVRLHEARDAILEHCAHLLPFLLIDEAATGKRTYAITEVARAKLPSVALKSCRTDDGYDEDERFDRRAMMWRLYLADPANLELVFHLDRTQRKGFAHMVLNDTREREGFDAAAFFTQANLQAILDTYEAEKETLRQSYCAEVLSDGGGRYRVFIKRDSKPAFVSHGPKNTFGFEREWIILAFEGDLRRVRICSVSPDVPLALANRIAGQYFGEIVKYENEVIESSLEAVRRFLKRLVSDPTRLPLVELVVKNCGLADSPQLRLSHAENASISTAVQQFSSAFGDPFAVVRDIESIKVYAFKKRVKMIFEPANADGTRFVVRYVDQPLNTKERGEFEEHMRRKHKIHVLSTEKRHADE